MPVTGSATDSFGALLLTASWLEDNAAQDEVLAQTQLFDNYLLPWAGTFLGKVEAHAKNKFLSYFSSNYAWCTFCITRRIIR